jgi:hypothetical protein
VHGQIPGKRDWVLAIVLRLVGVNANNSFVTFHCLVDCCLSASEIEVGLGRKESGSRFLRLFKGSSELILTTVL